MEETPKQRRVVLCRGRYCNLNRRANKLYKLLKPMVKKINGDSDPPRIVLESATCLSMCGAGPNCILYPEDIAFHYLDEESLKRMVDEHLRD